MNHPLVGRYRHRALVLWLSVVSLLLFIGIQAACYVIASHPRWLFILSFFIPNLIALTWGVRLADRRGLERGIILLGVAGVSFFIHGPFLASAVFTLASNPPLPPTHPPSEVTLSTHCAAPRRGYGRGFVRPQSV